MFASEMPHFNMEGHKKIGTSIGCLSSIVLTIICLVYASVKGWLCIYRVRPTINVMEI